MDMLERNSFHLDESLYFRMTAFNHRLCMKFEILVAFNSM